MKKFFIPLSIALSCQLHSVAQNIGIGTTSPTQKLTVNGAIKIGTTATWDTGSIRWNSVKKDFEGFVGDRWLSFTGGKSQWGNIEQYSYESGGIMAGHAWDTCFGHPFSYSDGRLVIAAPKKKTNLHDNAGWVRTSKLYSDGAWGNIDDIYSPAPGK